MNQSAHAGLDYSLGQSNINHETGIHYGVISQNSINLDCLDSVEYDYGKPHCPNCGSSVLSSDDPGIEPAYWNTGLDYACSSCEKCFWSEACFPEESLGWSLDNGEYKLTDCLDNDIFILSSPYYTHAQFCSPCVPGAGNLDTPCDAGPKTYCLGPEWFDQNSPMPYRCYKIADDTEVVA